MTDTATSQPTGDLDDLDAQSLEPGEGSTEKGGDPKPSSDGGTTKPGRPAERPQPERRRR